jgi:transcription antitermination factor NusG
MLKSENDTTNWFALYTAPRAEKKLAEQLQNNNIERFLPLFTELRQWSDRKKKITEPLLKRIVFIKATPKQLNDFYNYPHVKGVVKEFGKPAIIKEHEIKTLEIIAREWNGETITINENNTLIPGDQVEIKRGPFTGLVGKLLEIKGKHRLVVQLATLNVEFTVNIAKSQTKKID